MTTVNEGENPQPDEISTGNPNELINNPTALKAANEQMATLDVLVCGQCHSAYHFVDEFKEHKDSNNCTGKSPVRDSTESKAQVWAFLLWKCSSINDGSNSATDNSWKLYQQWCRMPEQQRTAWITAGTNVQSLSKFAHAKVMELKSDDQLVPVQATTTTGDVKKRGRPRKIKQEETEAQPSGEESDEVKTNIKPVQNTVSNTTSTPAPLKPKVTVKEKEKEVESVRGAQERVPAAERIARRTEREALPGSTPQEFVVEKILAKRFNPRKSQFEYLLKWEGYPHEQNTWEPVENMETCKHLLQAFEKQLARQKELKALRAQQQQQQSVQVKQTSTPLSQVVKQAVKKPESPMFTPTGRLQRSSKARALDQVKAWCGTADDEPPAKRARTLEDDDYSDPDDPKYEKKIVNGQSSPKMNVDQDLVKSLGLSGKGMPNIKGVIKVDPKHMPNLSTGVYIMSKSSGIMKIDSPGKIGPGLNLDQEVIKKQIMAAKQKKMEETRKQQSSTPVSQIKKTFGPTGQQVMEKTIITPSGQKIIQRTIQRPTGNSLGANGKSPVAILNKKLAQSQGDSIIRRGGSPRGRGRGSFSMSPSNIVRFKEKQVSFDLSQNTTANVEMSPGGTTGMLVQGDGPQPSLPVLTDEDGTEVKVEASAVKQLLEEGVGVDEGEEVSLLHAGHTPIMIRGEDGVLYQVAGENEAGQTLLVAAEGVEGAVEGTTLLVSTQGVQDDVEGVEGVAEGEAEGVTYVTREDGQGAFYHVWEKIWNN
ncbi:unnamed protein product [Leptidea sinapis]|uniref:Chromo domain-containing protein n=1 Tax=Leptidea sinapis TaxID=189913 RepID=A0A5E4PNP3_9NEOP|nr:unnamed protein product [Leptidea sinapis]